MWNSATTPTRSATSAIRDSRGWPLAPNLFSANVRAGRGGEEKGGEEKGGEGRGGQGKGGEERGGEERGGEERGGFCCIVILDKMKTGLGYSCSQ